MEWLDILKKYRDDGTWNDKTPYKVMYPVYRQSETWLRIRAAALARAGYQCEHRDTSGRRDCNTPINLEVHHIRYPSGGPDAWGTERPEDLVVLCDHHHKVIHTEPARDLTPAPAIPPVIATAEEREARKDLRDSRREFFTTVFAVSVACLDFSYHKPGDPGWGRTIWSLLSNYGIYYQRDLFVDMFPGGVHDISIDTQTLVTELNNRHVLYIGRAVEAGVPYDVFAGIMPLQRWRGKIRKYKIRGSIVTMDNRYFTGAMGPGKVLHLYRAIDNHFKTSGVRWLKPDEVKIIEDGFTRKFGRPFKLE
nr:MAG TPA: HNH endonuclease bacteriophage, HNH Endonuclease, DNA.52A [Bacteriophage sp.]